MFIKRFFEPALAQASYLIGCVATGEAIVIDPNRDVDQYIDVAAHQGLRITHVTETHIHADFVSGARELARRTHATLYLSDEGGAEWKYAFADEAALLHDGDRLQVGKVRIDVLHTPGHTPEHLTFLVTDGAVADRPIAAVTGDFVFVGDVGRPDLLERAAHQVGTMETSARALWTSLQLFAQHADWLQIWPGHGAGSSCGKGISAIPHSTLGYERRFNWAFTTTTEAEFVARVLEGQPDPPPYFAAMKRINKAGPDVAGIQPLSRLDDSRLTDLIARGVRVVDTRPAADYRGGYVPGTFNIPLNDSFVTWAGWLLPIGAPFAVVLEAGAESPLDALSRALALVGLDHAEGYFEPSALAYAARAGIVLGRIPQLTPAAVADRLATCDVAILDVRTEAEWRSGHLASAFHIPLGRLEHRLVDVPTDRPVIVHCQAGTRSAIATALLHRLGRTDAIDMAGGFAAWQRAGLPVARD